MCDTCPAHIPGPGEVTSGLLGMAVGAAMTKPGRRVLFWGICVPMLPFAVWGELHWWTLAVVAVLAAAATPGLLLLRKLHGHVVVAPATPEQRVAELERRRRNPIPQPALPRAMRKKLAAPARALPAPQKAIEPTRVLPPPAAARPPVIRATNGHVR